MAPSHPKRDSAPDAFGHHGGAGKRRRNNKQSLKTDKDGDLVMDSQTGNDGRISKGRGRGHGRGTARPHGPNRNTDHNRREALKQAEPGNTSKVHAPPQPSLRHLRLLGIEKSKAASNEDRGMSSLKSWLERRVNLSLQKQTRPNNQKPQRALIKKARLDGDTFYFSVPADQFSQFIRLDGFTFASANISIEEVSNRPGSPTAPAAAEGQAGDPNSVPNIKELFHSFLTRRYNPTAKLLDLGALGTDAELNAIGMFNTASTQSKFFPALMKYCDSFFKTAEEKRNTIESVSLANNALLDLEAVTTLAQTFPDTKNLDMSNNKFEKLGSIQSWRNRFRSLDHLILSGNPLEANVPTYNQDIMRWYPTLRFLNGVQVRSDEEASKPQTRGRFQQANKQQNQSNPVAGGGMDTTGGFGNASGIAQQPAQPDPLQQQQQLIAEVSRLTSMKPDFSRQCLEENGWDLQRALAAFETAKAALPPSAFIGQATEEDLIL